MRYIYFISDEDRYWIEVDNDGIAVRQIILSDGLYHISALEDCLAEGKVVDEEIDGDVTDISRADFEHVWEKTLEEYRPVWNSTKQRFKINDFIMAELAFYYPQGKIFKIDNILAITRQKSA